MIQKVSAAVFLSLADEYCLADVRSPAEFAEGHIPGSMNIPLFNDEERSVIGTLYHKQGREEAILKGLDIALPKVSGYIRSVRKEIQGKKLAVHCWRGGMRSEMMAEVFRKAGYSVILLEGGYKAYRHFIRDSFSAKANIIVLGGFTGCGKTEILAALADKGEQVIDLEHLASHKGSVFGALGQRPQPTNEQFENELYRIWSGMDLTKRIWLEDESRSIGRVALPPPVFEQISEARMIQVFMDKTLRIDRLVEEYSCFPKEMLAAAIIKIHDGLGGSRSKLALEALGEGDFAEVADFVLEYYDKAYQKAIDKRKNKDITGIRLEGSDARHHASQILLRFKETL